MNRNFGSLTSIPINVTPISTELINSKQSGIIGPIKNGDNVYIARYGGISIDFVPTFLSLSTQKCLEGNDDILIPSGNLSSGGTLDDVPQYTITSNKDPITGSMTVSFKNNSNGRNISTKKEDDKIFLVEGSIPASFILDQNTFSTWSNSENNIVALSFVNYNLLLKDGGKLSVCGGAKCEIKECISDNAVIPLGPIVLIPAIWYNNCENGESVLETSTKSSFCSVRCAYADLLENKSQFKTIGCGESSENCTSEKCVCAGEPLLGFTDKEDCKNGFRYKYCKIPETCNGTCKSACTNLNQVCIYTPSSTSTLLGGVSGVYTCISSGVSGASGTNSGTGCFIDLDCCTSPIGCDQVCVAGRCQKREIPEKDKRIIIIVGSILGLLILGIIIFAALHYSKLKTR